MERVNFEKLEEMFLKAYKPPKTDVERDILRQLWASISSKPYPYGATKKAPLAITSGEQTMRKRKSAENEAPRLPKLILPSSIQECFLRQYEHVERLRSYCETRPVAVEVTRVSGRSSITYDNNLVRLADASCDLDRLVDQYTRSIKEFNRRLNMAVLDGKITHSESAVLSAHFCHGAQLHNKALRNKAIKILSLDA